MSDETPNGPFERLVRELDRNRRGVAGLVRLAPEAVFGILGVVAFCSGIALIILGWAGVAHSRYLQQELAYVVSGGILGLALVIMGGFLYLGYIVTRQGQALGRLAQSLDDRPERTPTAAPVTPGPATVAPATVEPATVEPATVEPIPMEVGSRARRRRTRPTKVTADGSGEDLHDLMMSVDDVNKSR